MSAMMLSSRLEQQQREQRADARRRQRRQDRDRVDVALVEHAEHDVDGEQRRPGSAAARLSSESLERLRGAREVGVDRSPACRSRARRGGSPSTASPSATPGARLNESVTDGNCPWWLTDSGVASARSVTSADSGTCAPVGDAHVEAVERRRVRCRARASTSSTTRYWLTLRVDRRDLALAERVVERVVDRRCSVMPRRAAVSRSMSTSSCEAGGLLIGGHVLELGQLAQRRRARAAPTRAARRGSRPAACTGTACAPARPPMRTSCTACRKRLMPCTLRELRAAAAR